MARSFSDEQLAELARSPRDTVARLSTYASIDDAMVEFAKLVKSFRGFIDGFSAFVAGAADYLRQTHGFAATTELDAAVFNAGRREIVARNIATADLAPIDDAAITATVRTCLETGDQGGLLAAYDEYERRVRITHDLASGRPAAALSHVYRTYGVDELEACLRHCGDQTLLGWMPHDLKRPAHQRIGQWARMMTGNFATITVSETDEAFVITQDPCGTCGRQVLDGCYEPPIDFAVVREPHAITWGRSDVPVYRTHVAVMHDLMPIERIGQRWPEIQCPVGCSGGACTVTIRK